VNLSLAINHHWGGLNPTGYHIVNIAIHFGCSFILWAIVKRSLLLRYFAGRYESSAGWLALAVAMLWALHPLQTETVIYTTQRTELMMAFFYLATLYCSLRYWQLLPAAEGSETLSDGTVTRLRRMWLSLAIVSCLAGMASKEVMVSAPLMVLLFDRTFVSGSLTAALYRSWPIYIGLACTLVLLLILNMNLPRGESAGFGGRQQPAPIWWMTQCKILLMYLKLVVWPWPLLLYYELPYLNTLRESWMYVIPVAVLGIATLVLLWRNAAVGYLGAWFFAILFPTFVVPIGTEVAAERRMYLALAALAVLLVLAAEWMIRSWIGQNRKQRTFMGLPVPHSTVALPAVFLAIALGLASAHRCSAYTDEIVLWNQVIQHQPDNIMAHSNLGCLLAQAKRYPEASEHLHQAIQLNPDRDDLYNNIGNTYVEMNRLPEAEAAFRASLELTPNQPFVLANLGLALSRMGRDSEAIATLENALQLQPDLASAHDNLGIALAADGKIPQAIEHFREALRLGSSDDNLQNNVGVLLLMTGHVDESIAHLEKAAELRPDRADVQSTPGDALRTAAKQELAIEHYRAALQEKPDFVEAYFGLAQSLAALGQRNEAISTSQQGIDVAHSAGQTAEADKIEEWLAQYHRDLVRNQSKGAESQAPMHNEKPAE